MGSDEQKVAKAVERRKKFLTIEKYLVPGVVLTHTQCGASFAEHVLTRICGDRLYGYQTMDTWKIWRNEGKRKKQEDEISILNLTHINRTELGALEYVGEAYLSPIFAENKK